MSKKAHFTPVHILLYTLPGVPSVYYGSEFGIEGKKDRFSDASLRPALSLSDYADAVEKNPFTRLISALGKVRKHTPALSYGDYRELLLTNRQYAFSRNHNGASVLVTVNNDDSDYVMTLPAGDAAEYQGALSGERVSVNGGSLTVNVKANSGEIWVPAEKGQESSFDTKNSALPDAAEILESVSKKAEESQAKEETALKKEQEKPMESAPERDTAEVGAKETKTAVTAGDEAFEKGKIAGLQEAILAIMEKNGPVTDQMKKDVTDNVYHDSLIAWIKSFR